MLIYRSCCRLMFNTDHLRVVLLQVLDLAILYSKFIKSNKQFFDVGSFFVIDVFLMACPI